VTTVAAVLKEIKADAEAEYGRPFVKMATELREQRSVEESTD
jgi:hypothetical protein